MVIKDTRLAIALHVQGGSKPAFCDGVSHTGDNHVLHSQKCGTKMQASPRLKPAGLR